MTLKLLLLTSDPKRAEDLARLVEQTGRARVIGTAEAEELSALLRCGSVDAVFADLSEDAHAALDAFEAQPQVRPALIACGPTDDGQLVLRALRLGAREFLPSDVVQQDLAAALEKLSRSLEGPAKKGGRGAILSVMGGKGGVGATVIACQLASALRHLGRRVAVVDLSLPPGDVDLHFDLRPRYTLADLAEQGEAFDAAYLQTIAAEHSSGVRVLASPQNPEDAELVTATHVARALGLLELDHDFVIVDVARNWTEPVLQALELSDQILVVTLLDVPTLHHVRRQLAVLERLGVAAGKIKVVANRFSSADAVGDSEVRSFLGITPSARIPNDFPTVAASVNQGVPIAQLSPSSRLARAFAQVALDVHAWCGAPAPEVGKRHWLPEKLRSIVSRRTHGTR
jgi:pilus assembly protein CpaE